MMPAMPSSKKNHQMLDCWGCKAVVVMGRTSLLRACCAHSPHNAHFTAGHSLHPAGLDDAVLRFRIGIERYAGIGVASENRRLSTDKAGALMSEPLECHPGFGPVAEYLCKGDVSLNARRR